MKKLPKDFKEKWLKALRSGEYKQADGILREGDSFCCLGVACDIHDPTTWTLSGGCYETKSSSIYSPHAKDLPPDVLTALNQFYGQDNVMRHLSTKNDKGAPFTEIADWIEEHL